jgi:hypothetical protein
MDQDRADDGGHLSFRDKSLDLISNRHESFLAVEVRETPGPHSRPVRARQRAAGREHRAGSFSSRRSQAETSARCRYRGLVPRTPEKQHISHSENQDNRDVAYQPRQDMVPQEQDVDADYDRYHREHIQRGCYPSSHWFVLLCEASSSKQQESRS